MIATKDSFDPHSSEQLPNSRRVYLAGKIHPDLRVPMREISLSPKRAPVTDSPHSRVEVNEPVRVYDTSGSWGDAAFHGDSNQGLPPLRREWILGRADVEEYQGRPVRALDDGYLSEPHRQASWLKSNPDALPRNPQFRPHRPLRASGGHPVTQLWYARQGIITPEMEFI